jgi:succinyl-CoA synthetase beta subunit
VPLAPAFDPTDPMAVLESYGIPVAHHELAGTVEEAVAAAARAGGPVAMKLAEPALPHKSDRGAVELGRKSEPEIAAAFERLHEVGAGIDPRASVRIMVQAMVEGGVEIACGAFRDETFGIIVSVGLGGLLVEVMATQVYSLTPLSLQDARDLTRSVCGGRLASNARGLADAEIDAVAHVLLSLAELMRAHPEIAEAEVNPLIVGPGLALAVDGLLVTADAAE